MLTFTRSRNRTHRCLPWLAGLVIALGPAQSFAQSFELIDLGTLGGTSTSSIAVDINDNGQVTGHGTTGYAEVHAFLWDGKTSRLQDLGTLGGVESIPMALSDTGQVVGYSRNSAGVEHAFSWLAGEMTDLGTLDGGTSRALDVNNLGQIIGNSISEEFSERQLKPFLWTKADGMVDLGSLQGSHSTAEFINENGQVAGLSRDVTLGAYRAYLWSADSGMIDLGFANTVDGLNDLGQVAGTLGGIPFVADVSGRVDLPVVELGRPAFVGAINNAGQVAGFASTGSVIRAVLWEADGTIVDLGSLGGTRNLALDLNDAGHVVGHSITASGTTHGFFWSPQTGMLDLGTLPADPDDSQAVRINGSDRVAGSSLAFDPSVGFNLRHAVAWEPVAPPSGLPAEIAEVINLVQSYIDSGSLSAGLGSSLIAKLEAAAQTSSQPSAANILSATIIEIEALVEAGLLSFHVGGELVDSINAILDQL